MHLCNWIEISTFSVFAWSQAKTENEDISTPFLCEGLRRFYNNFDLNNFFGRRLSHR